MLINPKFYFYWDACVFIAHLNKEPGRCEIIDAVWDEVVKKEGQIVTSAISVIEVSKAQYERDGRFLDPAIEARLDAMWRDPFILTVDITAPLLFEARKLLRDEVAHGGGLKPIDAIHLTTAAWINRCSPTKIEEFHTYDPLLNRFAQVVGVPIIEPSVKQPKLF